MLDVGHLDAEDHRRIGRRMELFHFEEDAPGMVFWHDRGRRMFRQLCEAARRHVRRRDYRIVASPQLLRRPVWAASGHSEHFADAMFEFDPGDGPAAALKPVSCPGHLKIAARHLQSYRQLPMRIAEFGLVHRDEPSGSLHGLFRLRQFHQDDGHVLCRADAAVDEIVRFCESLSEFYAALELEPAEIVLALRPDDRIEDPERWGRAEEMLRQGARRAGLSIEEASGEGAFYGPKLEWHLEDHRGDAWQAGSVQADLFMPEQFGLSYANRNDAAERPVLLHRALCGSPERMLGLLLEGREGRMPVWMAAEQAAVVPISEDHLRYARRLAGDLASEGVRAEVDSPDRSVGRRIAENRDRGVPFVLVVGDREVDERSVAVRRWDDQQSMSRRRAMRHIVRAAEPPL